MNVYMLFVLTTPISLLLIDYLTCLLLIWHRNAKGKFYFINRSWSSVSTAKQSYEDTKLNTDFEVSVLLITLLSVIAPLKLVETLLLNQKDMG